MPGPTEGSITQAASAARTPKGSSSWGGPRGRWAGESPEANPCQRRTAAMLAGRVTKATPAFAGAGFAHLPLAVGADQGVDPQGAGHEPCPLDAVLGGWGELVLVLVLAVAQQGELLGLGVLGWLGDH